MDPAGPQAQAPVARVLRVGIVQAGRIIEEKLIRRTATVTVGSSMHNTFTILASSLPRSYTLFEVVGRRYHLNFTDAVDGRVSIHGRIFTLAQAVKENLAPRHGTSGWRLKLSSDARGKIVLGEVTVLFQFVAPPPLQPRAKLPPSIRGGFLMDLDWNLASCFVLLLCLEFGFVAYLRTVDWPRKLAIDQVPDRFARYIVIEKPKPKPKEAAAKTTTEEVAAKGETPAETQAKRRPKAVDPEAAARAAAERRARLAEQVSRLGALKILGSRGRGGAVADLISRGDASADADRAFANVGGVGVASAGSAGGSLLGKGGSGAGAAVGLEGLRSVGGPGAVDTAARGGEREVKGIVKDEAPSVDGTIDAGVIAKEIRRRMGAVRACYERELKRNPQLGGKIVIRFVIGATGAVTEAEVESSSMGDDAVPECIILNIKRFRFPAPEGGSVEVSYPFVFQPSS
jgi:TonB family protein